MYQLEAFLFLLNRDETEGKGMGFLLAIDSMCWVIRKQGQGNTKWERRCIKCLSRRVPSFVFVVVNGEGEDRQSQ